MTTASKYDKYRLTDYEQHVLEKSIKMPNGKAICGECGNMVNIKFLRKKPEEGVLHAKCLLCFSNEMEEVEDDN